MTNALHLERNDGFSPLPHHHHLSNLTADGGVQTEEVDTGGEGGLVYVSGVGAGLVVGVIYTLVAHVIPADAGIQ
ncbi:hypothetical protein CEE37_13615 [candidate division LCP-89 bacterium B3_LCP]|uniref:Uncharacterized protein n=1 Tax=candidate division LCP-89 bacterium B3_LCP TaxID=2012998 RepID=A0A532USS7_UNCL8|nr:MAG: hypothetical protein CEE37_13615 [candidate division LCP-89 bacterium B3_LCP]